MRRMIAGIAFLCACAGACVTSVAQTTITAADVDATLAVGNSIVTVTDTMTSSVNIGSPGATSWDFSGLLTSSSTTMMSVTPSTSPFIAQFPGSTHVLKASLVLAFSFSGLTGTAAGDVYTYLKLDAARLVNAGGMGNGTVTLTGGSPLTAQLLMPNVPPDTTYALPISIGTRWGSTYSSKDSVTVAILGGFLLSSKNHVTSYVADAYGPMKMPGGSMHDALRIRKLDNSGNTTVGYIFLAKDGATVQISASDPALPDNGTIPVAPGSVTWTGGLPTSVQNSKGVPEEFSLLQNYPNPFNPTTELGYKVPVTAYVTLKVYDLLGREVAVLVNDRKEPGSYSVLFNASGLTTGVYFYRLIAGTYVESRKMVLMK